MVKLPRAVTDWRVSRPPEEAGHPTPLDKQMPTPETVAVAKLAVFAYKNVEVTVANVPVEANKNVPVALRKLRLETVPVAAERILIFALVAVAVVKLPKVAKRLVVVTEVPVAVVKSTLRSEVEPTTTNVPVTLEEAATNPPKNWAVVVVKLPRAVADWRVSRPEEAGQLVPSERQTLEKYN